jgi:signal transduction histidine kinase
MTSPLRASILMVDDGPDNLAAMETILEPLGERLVRAGSGAEALRHLLDEDFALILLDLQMPGMGGYEVAERIKDWDRTRGVPIIFLTANEAGPHHTFRGYGPGAVDYLAKPFDPVILRSKVSVFVDLFRKTQEMNEQARRLQRSFEAITGLQADVERARAEAERAKEEAHLANRAKTEFLSRVSHDLRTPLNAILGFAQILEMEAHDPEQRMMVGHILEGGKHLLNLINELLDISRIESGTFSLSMEGVDVAELISEVVDLTRPVAGAQGIAINVSGAASGSCYALADRQRLRQVLLNLVSKAVKCNRPAGTVHLSVSHAEDGRLRVEVADTGPGISPDDLERLFDPVERRLAGQTDVEGTGLGLAVSKRLAEAMGGGMGVETRPGDGSTFWVELTAAEAQPLTLNEEAAPPPPASPVPQDAAREGAAGVLLYIEDNISNINLLECLMTRRPNVDLFTTMQGRLALDLARTCRPDLILLDLHLPDAGGDEVLEWLRRDPSTRAIPVVMLSADATPTEISRLLDAGAIEYLTKPVDLGRLLAVLDEHMGGRSREA